MLFGSRRIERLERQVRNLRIRNRQLQLYPSDRDIPDLVRHAKRMLDQSRGDRTMARQAMEELFLGLPEPAKQEPPSLVISGPVRCGKSTVSKLVALQSSASYFQLDIFRRLWLNKAGEKDDFIFEMILENLLAKYRNGTVIEGRALIFKTMLPARSMIEFFRKNGLRVVLVGSATASIERKIDALVGYQQVKSCWTEGLTTDALRDHAEMIVSTSIAARRIAAEAGIDYFELSPDTFGRDMRHTVNTIIDTYGFA